jgi:hypothetical protein
MPAVEEVGLQFDAAAVLSDRRLQVAEREISVCVVEELFNFRPGHTVCDSGNC